MYHFNGQNEEKCITSTNETERMEMKDYNKENLTGGQRDEFFLSKNEITKEEYQLRLEKMTDKDIAVFYELGDLPVENVHAEAYVAILCLMGKASCTIEGVEYQIEKNDLMLAHPNQFIQNAMVSCDFKCRGLLMSAAYFENVFMLGGNIWQTSLMIREQPLLHLSEEEVEEFLLDFEVLKHKLSATHLPHHEQIVKLMLQSLVFEFYDRMSPMLQQQAPSGNYSSAEILFKRFLSLASAESPRRREVAYYADKLCITPKYLSAVCKKQTDKTASEIINGLTVNYIKNMLTSSDKTIKEIAGETGFDNLSFFGKYVKRELGMSPRDYRQKGA